MKNILFITLTAGMFFTGCSQSSSEKTAETDIMKQSTETFAECDIRFGGVNFNKSKNGGSEGVTINGDTLIFIAGPQTDYFHSPTGDFVDNSPVVFTEIDNTRPFTFTARVSPGFTETGTYSAGVIYAYENADHCQKICFEQDEYGDHRIVTVRTIGTSDDNNHQSIPGSSVYMRLSSDGKLLGTYFSEDGNTWRMARLYKNDFPEKLLIGLSSQSPVDDSHTCNFTEVALVEEPVTDFRMGKIANEQHPTE